MRTLIFGIVLAFLFPATAWGDEVSDLRDKVLKAAAKSPDDLAKLRVHTLKATGVSEAGGGPVPASFELNAVWPDQFKASWAFGGGANKRVITMCHANGVGWKKIDDNSPTPLGVEEFNDLRMDTYAVWASTLTTLTNIDIKLSMAPPSKVGDDAVVGLKLTRKNFPEVTLYFDAKSHLLRKMVYRSREAGVNTTKEMYFGGHKDVQGLMLPTKQTTEVRGVKVYSWTEMDFSFPKAIDSKVFEK